MRIQYMSDLHMELWDNSQYIKANKFETKGDVLVLAGDTFYLRDTGATQKKFWNWASKNYRQSHRRMDLWTFAYQHRHYDRQHSNSMQPIRVCVL